MTPHEAMTDAAVGEMVLMFAAMLAVMVLIACKWRKAREPKAVPPPEPAPAPVSLPEPTDEDVLAMMAAYHSSDSSRLNIAWVREMRAALHEYHARLEARMCGCRRRGGENDGPES